MDGDHECPGGLNTGEEKKSAFAKCLGSAEWQIIYLLSTDFTRIVLIAILIALPFSYWMAHRWLDGFAYKAEITI